MVTAEDLDARRAKLRRSRRRNAIAAVGLGLLALLWLTALSPPAEVEGFIVLEIMTIVPLVVVLWRYRRAKKRFDDLPATNEVITPVPVLEPPSPLTFDPAVQPQLVLRPRWPFVLLALVGPGALLLLLLK